MKIFIVLFIFYLMDNSLAVSFYEENEIAENDCFREQQLTAEDFYRISKAQRTILFKCIYEKLGYIKDGIIQKNVILEKSKNSAIANKYKYGVRLCEYIISNDEHDLAYKLSECFKKTNPDYFQRNWNILDYECKDEVKISKDDYKRLQYFPLENITEPMKLFTKCMMKTLGFLKYNNLQEKVVLEVSEDFEDAKYLKAFLKECKGIKEDNENDTSFKLYECLENVKEKYVQSTEDQYKLAQKSCLQEKQLSPHEVYHQQSPYKQMFANCVFEKMGYTKNGLVRKDLILEKYETSKYQEHHLILLAKCINTTQSDAIIDHELEVYNIALCFDLFSGEHFLKDWQKANKECIDIIEAIHDIKYPNMKMKKPTPAVQYYAACIFKKLGFLKANTLQKNVVFKALEDYRDAEYLKTFLSKCKHIKEKEHIDTAYKLYQCMDKIIHPEKKYDRE